jgi:uncharacterized protein
LPTFTPLELVACVAVAFIAGLIDAMAGGGGIFTMPTLAAIGLPVPMIAGTNKFVASGGSSTATISFLLRGRLDRKVALIGGFCSLTGAVLGALTLMHLGKMNEGLAKGLFGGLLLVMAVYMFLKPRFGGEYAYAGLTPRNLAILVAAGLAIGFYDGFFGPGTGSFLVFVMVRWLRFDFVMGTGNAKAMNFASNIASLVTFIVGGLVVWQIAVPMACANACGAWVGSTLAIKQGARFVRWAFLFAAVCIAGRLFWYFVS